MHISFPILSDTSMLPQTKLWVMQYIAYICRRIISLLKATSLSVMSVSWTLLRDVHLSINTAQKVKKMVLNILNFCVVHICYASTYSIYQLHKKVQDF